MGAIITLLLFSSCGSTRQTGMVPQIHPDVATSQMNADLDIDEQRIYGKSTHSYFLGIRLSGGNKFYEDQNTKSSIFGKRGQKAQASAMYNALEKGDYDMIINPQYRSSRKSYLLGLIKVYKVKVNGFGGKIKRIRQDESTYVLPHGRILPSQNNESDKTTIIN